MNLGFYPNPSNGNFTLDLDLTDKEEAIISITDISGKEVYTEKVRGNGKPQNLSIWKGKQARLL